MSLITAALAMCLCPWLRYFDTVRWSQGGEDRVSQVLLLKGQLSWKGFQFVRSICVQRTPKIPCCLHIKRLPHAQEDQGRELVHCSCFPVCLISHPSHPTSLFQAGCRHSSDEATGKSLLVLLPYSLNLLFSLVFAPVGTVAPVQESPRATRETSFLPPLPDSNLIDESDFSVCVHATSSTISS